MPGMIRCPNRLLCRLGCAGAALTLASAGTAAGQTNSAIAGQTNPPAAASSTVGTESTRVPSATLKPEALDEFEEQPAAVQRLVSTALYLTTLDLPYRYGGAGPDDGGFDCSGFVYHALRQAGIAGVPRQSNRQYVWIRKAGNFQAVLGLASDSFELNDLRPGDLMFWTGTYDVKRDPPVTHSMIYLGTLKKDGRRVMAGSSNGRTFNGIPRDGGSVFDFFMPGFPEKRTTGRSRFVGYGTPPGLRNPEP